MNNADKLQHAMEANKEHLQQYLGRISPICEKIRGWSNVSHYMFFKSWLDAFPAARSFLIVGVYLGRDISFLLDAAGDRPLRVVGVDKFNAEPCDDWPAEKRGMTWEQAFNCPPPSRTQAVQNIGAKPWHDVTLIEADDKEWLEKDSGTYDIIFLDASHDYASIARQIKQVRKLCHENTIVSGDDYANVQPGWGVTEAVTEAFNFHYHIDYRIWFAGAEDYK
jgi:hypothetical protein